jgi:hypothetical protein
MKVLGGQVSFLWDTCSPVPDSVLRIRAVAIGSHALPTLKVVCTRYIKDACVCVCEDLRRLL